MSVPIGFSLLPGIGTLPSWAKGALSSGVLLLQKGRPLRYPKPLHAQASNLPSIWRCNLTCQ